MDGAVLVVVDMKAECEAECEAEFKENGILGVCAVCWQGAFVLSERQTHATAISYWVAETFA